MKTLLLSLTLFAICSTTSFAQSALPEKSPEDSTAEAKIEELERTVELLEAEFLNILTNQKVFTSTDCQTQLVELNAFYLSKLDAFRTSLEGYIHENNALKTQLNDCENERDNLGNMVNSLVIENDDLVLERDTLAAALEVCQDKVESSRVFRETALNTISSLQEGIASRNDLILQKDIIISDLFGLVESTSEELQIYKEDLFSCQLSLEECQSATVKMLENSAK